MAGRGPVERLPCEQTDHQTYTIENTLPSHNFVWGGRDVCRNTGSKLVQVKYRLFAQVFKVEFIFYLNCLHNADNYLSY